jgi:hypothetical protein
MMGNARRVVSNGAPPAESVAAGGKKIAGKPKRGEHKRKRLKTDARGAQLERKTARQKQIVSTIRRGSAATDTAVAAGPTTKTKTSSKKNPLQKPNKIGVAAEQKIVSSSKGGLKQGKGVERQTSTYRGVWLKRDNKWAAQITYDGKQRSLGYFADEEEAAKAYDRAARAQHGEKARRCRMQLNFNTKKEQAAEEAKQQRWIKCGEAGSKYRGVSWNKRANKWKAQINYDSKKRGLGYFKDEEEAARAYDKAARTQHGEKAQLNFPTGGESGTRQSSKYRGVIWHKSRNKWEAKIMYDGKQHHLGSFEDEEEAAKAYDRAARAHQGNAAKPNFEQPAKQHRGGGGTARNSAEYVILLSSSSSSLPSPRKRPRAKQSNPAKRSKKKASKSSDVKAVDESKCYVCNCDVPEYTSSNHKSFRLRAPPVPVCGTECEAAYLAERGCTHFINTGRGKHHRLRIRTHATCIPTVYSLAQTLCCLCCSKVHRRSKQLLPWQTLPTSNSSSSSADGAGVWSQQ